MLNRAVVFSGVSLVVVGLFVLAEWVVTQLFSNLSHTTNLLISAALALALALGFSVRAIHMRVDRVLELIFFRKRHEDEQAIRTFAHEAAYLTDVATLVARTEATLEERANASDVTVMLSDGGGTYGAVSENDPAIIALKAWHKPVDLHGLQTDVLGELAYPMVARGRLLGALVLGPKRSGESYAPDESDAIAQLAHGVGSALDVLSANGHASRAGAIERLADEIGEFKRELASEMNSLTQELRALSTQFKNPR